MAQHPEAEDNIEATSSPKHRDKVYYVNVISNGEPLLGGTVTISANVIFQTAEDGLADAIKLRLEQHASNCRGRWRRRSANGRIFRSRFCRFCIDIVVSLFHSAEALYFGRPRYTIHITVLRRMG